MNFATNRGNSLFALALRKDVKNPFAPQSDEVTITKPGDDAADKSKAGDKKEEKPGDKKDEKKKEPVKV